MQRCVSFAGQSKRNVRIHVDKNQKQRTRVRGSSGILHPGTHGWTLPLRSFRCPAQHMQAAQSRAEPPLPVKLVRIQGESAVISPSLRWKENIPLLLLVLSRVRRGRRETERRNGLIKRKEGEDYEEDEEIRGEIEDKSAIGELPAKTGGDFLLLFFKGQSINQINLMRRLSVPAKKILFFIWYPLTANM